MRENTRINRIKAFAVICLAAMMVLLCMPLKAEAAGNSAGNATKVNFGTKTNGYIKDGSNDWYKLVLPSSGRLTIKVHTEIDIVHLKFYDTDATSRLFYDYLYWDFTTKVGNGTYTIDLTAGTYYFLISEHRGCGSYNFTATYTPAAESFMNGYDTSGKWHGDGSMASANSIGFGKSYTGQMAANESLDFFKFTLNQSANVTLDAKAWMRGIYYDLYDADGRYLAGNYAVWNSTTGVSNFSKTYSLGKGTYYLVLKSYAIDSTGTYSFKLTNDIPKGWKTVSGKTYYYNANGVKLTGWQTIGGKKYYFNADGSAKTGWLKYNNKWYFFDVSTLTPVIGKRRIGGIMCTFNSDGTLKMSLPKELSSYLKTDLGIFIRHTPKMKDIGCTTAKVYSDTNLMVSDKAYNNKIQSITVQNKSLHILKGVSLGMTKAQVQAKLKGQYKSVKNGTEYKLNDGNTLKITYTNGVTSKVVLVVG